MRSNVLYEEKVPVDELIINWDLNPRGYFDIDALDLYSSHIQEFLSSGEDISEVWKQKVQVTKDLHVLKGCHTVRAILDINPKYELSVEVIDVESTNLDEARFWSAQSNTHGLHLSSEQKRTAVMWILNRTNLLDEDEDPDLKPHMSNRQVGAIVGCSPETVRRYRNFLVDKRMGRVEYDNPERSNEPVSSKEPSSHRQINVVRMVSPYNLPPSTDAKEDEEFNYEEKYEDEHKGDEPEEDLDEIDEEEIIRQYTEAKLALEASVRKKKSKPAKKSPKKSTKKSPVKKSAKEPIEEPVKETSEELNEPPVEDSAEEYIEEAAKEHIRDSPEESFADVIPPDFVPTKNAKLAEIKDRHIADFLEDIEGILSLENDDAITLRDISASNEEVGRMVEKTIKRLKSLGDENRIKVEIFMFLRHCLLAISDRVDILGY